MTRKFGRSTFARSLIFKFEISAILKFYCSKFWPSSIPWLSWSILKNLSTILNSPLQFSKFRYNIFKFLHLKSYLQILIRYRNRSNCNKHLFFPDFKCFKRLPLYKYPNLRIQPEVILFFKACKLFTIPISNTKVSLQLWQNAHP